MGGRHSNPFGILGSKDPVTYLTGGAQQLDVGSQASKKNLYWVFPFRFDFFFLFILFNLGFMSHSLQI